MLQINVGQLVIGKREGARGAGIDDLPTHLHAKAKEAGLPQRPIDVDRALDGHDAVFRDDDHLVAVAIGRLDQPAGQFVDFAQILAQARIGGVRSPFL